MVPLPQLMVQLLLDLLVVVVAVVKDHLEAERPDPVLVVVFLLLHFHLAIVIKPHYLAEGKTGQLVLSVVLQEHHLLAEPLDPGF